MRYKLNDQGATALLVIAAIVLVAAVAGVGVYVYTQSTSNNGTGNTQTVPEIQDSTSATTAPMTESKSGTFTNIGSKTGSGSVTLIKNETGGYQVQLGEDFKVQQGPDLFVSFGNDGKYAEGTAFAELKSLSGAQEYTVPDTINVTDYSQVVIWCREFNTPFTAATLQ